MVPQVLSLYTSTLPAQRPRPPTSLSCLLPAWECQAEDGDGSVMPVALTQCTHLSMRWPTPRGSCWAQVSALRKAVGITLPSPCSA